MAYPPYSIVNNQLLIDAIFMRDYHGNDSTAFGAGSSKNGMSPQNWSCPVSQGVPDKNELLDVMAHVRRAGPGTSDSLWMFGGVSIENTNGDRYFDYEMYQTSIYYDRSTRSFRDMVLTLDILVGNLMQVEILQLRAILFFLQNMEVLHFPL